jgi:hypothetical protein
LLDNDKHCMQNKTKQNKNCCAVGAWSP